MKRDSLRGRDGPRRRRAASARLADCRATVIGLNGVGRQVAAQLAALGVGSLRLVDAGTVPTRRYGDDGYLADDAGRARTHATAELCHQLNPLLEVQAARQLKPLAVDSADAVFCCTDSPEARRYCRRHFAGRVRFYAEVRASENVVHILLSCTSQAGQEPRRLARPESLGLSSSGRRRLPLFVAAIAAGLVVGEFSRSFVGRRIRRGLRLDLRTLRLTVRDWR